MALAGNSVLAFGGGIVLVDRGRILFELKLPYGGTMSDLPMRDLARKSFS